MSLTNSDWNRRFIQQAGWTRSIRQYLLEKSNITSETSILDVGCGTGAVEMDWMGGGREMNARFYGLDIRQDYLRMAANQVPGFGPIQGDARRLPFAKRSFQASFCHFLLLWVPEPVTVIREMERVTRAGGAVIAFAEPDYGGRIDYPANLGRIGLWQEASLRRQGADAQLGRKLRHIFQEAKLVQVETGVLGGRWKEMPDGADLEAEWAVIESDLEFLELSGAEMDELSLLRTQDAAAWQAGARVLYVPLFYAWGRVGA